MKIGKWVIVLVIVAAAFWAGQKYPTLFKIPGVG